MSFRISVWIGLLVALGFVEPAAATHPGTQQDGLDCEVHGNSVALRWNIQFFAPIEGWVLCRDGVDIAHLSPDAIAYRDIGVEDGGHFYVLKAVNRQGEILRLAACVVVVGDFDLSCRVDVDDVYVQWLPPIIDAPAPDVAFSEYVIRRDGEVVGACAVGRLTLPRPRPRARNVPLYRSRLHLAGARVHRRRLHRPDSRDAIQLPRHAAEGASRLVGHSRDRDRSLLRGPPGRRVDRADGRAELRRRAGSR